MITRLIRLGAPLVFVLLFMFAAALDTVHGENQVQVVSNLPYKCSPTLTAYEQERCRLDLYLPKDRVGFPILVWFHGGALTQGTKDDDFSAEIANRLASLGIAVAVANYRLSPAAKFPAYIEDAAAAVAWTHRNVARHRGDPKQLFIGGHSAGAYLTFMIGLNAIFLKPHGMTPDEITGLIPVSGQTMTHYTVREERRLPKDRIIADEAAPIYHVRKDAPPLLIVLAENDLPARREENAYLCAALKAAGHERVFLHTIPDRDHGTVAGRIAEPGDPVANLIRSFTRDQTKSSWP